MALLPRKTNQRHLYIRLPNGTVVDMTAGTLTTPNGKTRYLDDIVQAVWRRFRRKARAAVRFETAVMAAGVIWLLIIGQPIAAMVVFLLIEIWHSSQ